MDYAIVFTVLLSLHIECDGSRPRIGGDYSPPINPPPIIPNDGPGNRPGYLPPTVHQPPPPTSVCSIDVKQDITTIPVTKTEQLTPITETRIPPGVTSFMEMPPITDTFTVVEWTTLQPSTLLIPLPPVTSTTTEPCFTVVSTIDCTTTETMEPVTETSMREVLKLVRGMPMTSTVFLTSTVTQQMAFKTIYLGDVTTTITYPPSVIHDTTTLVSTVIQPPQTTTVVSKWIMTHTPEPVTERHSPIYVYVEPHQQTITITVPSTILIPHTTIITTSYTTSTSCTTTYSITEPSKPWNPNVNSVSYNFDLPIGNPTPTRTFAHQTSTATPNNNNGFDERDRPNNRNPNHHNEFERIKGTPQPYDYYDYEFEHNTLPSFGIQG